MNTTHISERVGILAGMGPAAGVDFVSLFVAACESWLRAHGRTVTDQAYPEHWMAQLPVPDRTLALSDPAAAQPLEPLVRGLSQLADLGACAAAIPCNTAHAWHGQLQARVPHIELLHMPRETAAELHRQGVDRVALLATQGTYRQGLYDTALTQAGIACIVPSEQEREWLMQGIYDGVKAGNLLLAQERFEAVGMQLRAAHGDVPLVMACTEIPLALPAAARAREQNWALVDPSAILAAALARRAYGGRRNK